MAPPRVLKKTASVATSDKGIQRARMGFLLVQMTHPQSPGCLYKRKASKYSAAMSSPFLHILWDESQIWGLIAARAARAMRLPHRLVRSADIAAGLLSRERPSLLLVPGGNARHKAESLGPAGIKAIRDYVATGGRYMGFCGGAGLALTWGEGGPVSGLGICPWKRGRFDERMQHFMSGHLHMSLPGREGPCAALLPPDLSNDMPDQTKDAPRLPVWWPGRFAAEPHESITILAAYERPADDFWLADLAIADLPADAFAAWHDVYGVNLTPTFLAGQPCVLYGEHGRGGYLLSYSHLETPDSPQANYWLAHLFRELGGLSPAVNSLPPWQRQSPAWDDADLNRLDARLQEIAAIGLKHGLLFARTDWLMAWRSGLPGANLNNLWAALRAVREREPTNEARAFWNRAKETAVPALELFAKGCSQYLLAERLALTLGKSLPEALPPEMLKDQRESLFGPPMQAGGLYREIIAPLDELAYLQLGGKGV